MGSCSLLQGIFPTQGSSPGLARCRRVLHQLIHEGSPSVVLCVPRNAATSVGSWVCHMSGLVPIQPYRVDIMALEADFFPKGKFKG